MTHEIAHLIYTELTSKQKVEFAEILGWNLSVYPPTPPNKGLYSDSTNSPSEDIANHLEAYFFDSEKQFRFNKKIPKFIHSIIGQMK